MKNLTVFPVLILVLLVNVNSVQATRVVLDNVPHYLMHTNVVPSWVNGGCTPTAAGALMAYWDSQPGFENLYKQGDAQIWQGDATQGTKRMVASQNYINGVTNPPDCLASFLKTDLQGGTQGGYIASGLKAFAEWDDTSAYDMKDDYEAIVNSWGYQSFDFVKSEIDAGRPVLLTMVKATKPGHSVLAYGYDDDTTFQLYDLRIDKSITVPGFAVMDTWTAGSGDGSRWYDFDGVNVLNVEEIFDGGQEWWPYAESSGLYLGPDDWQVQGVYSFELVPEPATIILFGLGGLMLRRKLRV